MRYAALVAATALMLGGCSNLSTTEQRVLSGAGLGAAGGAAVGVVTGATIGGAAVVGGALGAAGGYIYDKVQKGDE